jgi:hypothetical protein
VVHHSLHGGKLGEARERARRGRGEPRRVGEWRPGARAVRQAGRCTGSAGRGVDAAGGPAAEAFGPGTTSPRSPCSRKRGWSGVHGERVGRRLADATRRNGDPRERVLSSSLQERREHRPGQLVARWTRSSLTYARRLGQRTESRRVAPAGCRRRKWPCLIRTPSCPWKPSCVQSS